MNCLSQYFLIALGLFAVVFEIPLILKFSSNFPQIRCNLNEKELDGNVLVKFETNGEIQVQSESFGEILEMIILVSYENNI